MRPGVKILDVRKKSTFSGEKDDFGYEEEVPPLPMPFNQVCEDRGPRSTVLLFRLSESFGNAR